MGPWACPVRTDRQERPCQFQMRSVWSSEALTIQGWGRKSRGAERRGCHEADRPQGLSWVVVCSVAMVWVPLLGLFFQFLCPKLRCLGELNGLS